MKVKTPPVRYSLYIFCAVLILVSYVNTKKKARLKEAASLPFYNVSVEQVADGTYRGQTYTSFQHVQLDVTVKNHRLTDITVIENTGRYEQDMSELIGRMLEKNSPMVPALKGKELLSLVFISCTDDALKKGLAKNEE